MAIEDIARELLAQPLDSFTARRNAKTKELKASGRTELAGELSALKKPSLSLWAANQLGREDRALLQRLRESAQAVVKAQAAAGAGRSNAARDLRAASEDFQRNLETAGNAAVTVLRRGKHATGEDTIRRVREILRLSALQGTGTWDRLQAGALITEPRAGDDVFEMFGPASPPTGREEAKRAERRRAKELAEKTAQADAERAEQAAATARRFRQEANELAVAADRAAQRAAAAEEEAARAKSQAEISWQAIRDRASSRLMKNGPFTSMGQSSLGRGRP